MAWKIRKAKLSDEQIDALREKVLKSIAPLKPTDDSGRYEFGTDRSNAGQDLPEHYLVYFLLVELLNFRHNGRGEKVAWTVPVDYEGHFALIEHRKMGLGVFSKRTGESEKIAVGIVQAVRKGVKCAAPFLDHLAGLAVEDSRLNVTNNSAWLFGRYEYLRDLFREKAAVAESQRDVVEKTVETLENGRKVTSYSRPAFEISKHASWLGIAAVEAFFSWTEHVLIHIAILLGKLQTGEEVANLALSDWSEKVKTAIGLDDAKIKGLFDELLSVRRQIRNYIAHGAFGKHGEAFDFHSRAGAVPVNLTDAEGRDTFSIWLGPSFEEAKAIETAESFIEALWSGDLAPAKLYLQDASMPVILTYARNGAYQRAMSSSWAMEQFVEGLAHQMDTAANMEW